jgi:hypothetical protein
MTDADWFSPRVAISGGYGMCELIVSVLQFYSAAEPAVCRVALLNLVVTGCGKAGLAGKQRGVVSSVGFERGWYRQPLCEHRFSTRSLFTEGVNSLFTRQNCNRSSVTGFTGSLSNTNIRNVT